MKAFKPFKFETVVLLFLITLVFPFNFAKGEPPQENPCVQAMKTLLELEQEQSKCITGLNNDAIRTAVIARNSGKVATLNTEDENALSKCTPLNLPSAKQNQEKLCATVTEDKAGKACEEAHKEFTSNLKEFNTACSDATPGGRCIDQIDRCNRCQGGDDEAENDVCSGMDFVEDDNVGADDNDRPAGISDILNIFNTKGTASTNKSHRAVVLNLTSAKNRYANCPPMAAVGLKEAKNNFKDAKDKVNDLQEKMTTQNENLTKLDGEIRDGLKNLNSELEKIKSELEEFDAESAKTLKGIDKKILEEVEALQAQYAKIESDIMNYQNKLSEANQAVISVSAKLNAECYDEADKALTATQNNKENLKQQGRYKVSSMSVLLSGSGKSKRVMNKNFIKNHVRECLAKPGKSLQIQLAKTAAKNAAKSVENVILTLKNSQIQITKKILSLQTEKKNEMTTELIQDYLRQRQKIITRIGEKHQEIANFNIAKSNERTNLVNKIELTASQLRVEEDNTRRFQSLLSLKVKYSKDSEGLEKGDIVKAMNLLITTKDSADSVITTCGCRFADQIGTNHGKCTSACGFAADSKLRDDDYKKEDELKNVCPGMSSPAGSGASGTAATPG